MPKSTKLKYIQRYIIYKIYNKEWHENEKIPSQKQLAKKFNCSLPTSRAALLTFIHSGILYSRRGKGFFVVPNANEKMFGSVGKKIKSFKQEIKIINNNHLIIPKINEFIRKFGLTLEENDVRISFIKNYYDKQKALIYHQISFLNKNTIFEVDLPMIRQSLIKFLLNYGIVPAFFNELVAWGRLSIFDHKARKMGWKTHYPIIVTTLFNESWIEITIKITTPNRIMFAKSGRTLL